MTQLEKLKNLLNEFGVMFREEIEKDIIKVKIEVEYFEHPKVTGWFGFCTDYEFDTKGNFIKIRIFE